jgi:hypothetical protein
VANGFYSKLEDDRRALSERLQAERNAARAGARSERNYVCTDLAHMANPKLSDFVKRRYGKIRSIGRPNRARKSSYYVGRTVGRKMVLHRGIETASTACGFLLPE